MKSTLKKAALVGGGAYVGYKLGKMRSKFSLKPKTPDFDFEFDDWNSWREADGFLCRKDSDCTFVDGSMECQDYELAFTPSVSPEPCPRRSQSWSVGFSLISESLVWRRYCQHSRRMRLPGKTFLIDQQKF